MIFKDELRRKFCWLLRIKHLNDLEEMSNGNFKFSLPKYWLKNGNGINDISEGAYIITSTKSNTYAFTTRSSRIINFKQMYNNKVYIRDSRIYEMPTLCFYGIESGEKEFDISQEYFKDFSNNSDSYGFIIVDASSFASELKNSLIKNGLKCKNLYSHSIVYIDKSNDFVCENGFPYELFIKDKLYSHQSEYRFVINTDNVRWLNKFKNIDNMNCTIKININKTIFGFHELPKKNEKVHIKIDKNNHLEIFYV